MATFGKQMAELKLNEKWLVREGKVLIRKTVSDGQIGGTAKTASAPCLASAEAEADRAAARPYQVPDDFDASLITAVDSSSAEAAHETLSKAVALRWIDLRTEVRFPCGLEMSKAVSFSRMCGVPPLTDEIMAASMPNLWYWRDCRHSHVPAGVQMPR